MQRVTAANHSSNQFTDGPPGTDLEEVWHNSVQEEICGVIEAEGLTLDVADQGQLDEAIDLKVASGTILAGSAALRNACIGWKDADEFYIYANDIMINGKRVYWDSTLTKTVAGLANDTWYYVYLDDSELSHNEELTDATEIIYSTTAPGAYDATYKYYANGADRCIGCFLSSGAGAILEFRWVEGDYILDDQLATTVSLTEGVVAFTDLDLSGEIPNFGVMNAYIVAYVQGGNAGTSYSQIAVRPNGSSGSGDTHGIYLTNAAGNSDSEYYGLIPIITDSSQVIEWKEANAAVDKVTINVKGIRLTI